MKFLGLVGGTSWPSTISYYEALNRGAQGKLGGHHSARLLLYSIDYHPIKSLYNHGWDKIPALLEAELRRFLDMKPDCLILCNNVLHKALDIVAPALKIAVPVFHAGHLAAEEAQRMGCKSVLLLGTIFTMEDGFFARYFEALGIQVQIPSAEDRATIQDIQRELAKGASNPAFAETFRTMLRRYPEADAIVLACTELPLAITAVNAPKPLINPILCQCEAAVKFAFEDTA